MRTSPPLSRKLFTARIPSSSIVSRQSATNAGLADHRALDPFARELHDDLVGVGTNPRCAPEARLEADDPLLGGNAQEIGEPTGGGEALGPVAIAVRLDQPVTAVRPLQAVFTALVALDAVPLRKPVKTENHSLGIGRVEDRSRLTSARVEEERVIVERRHHVEIRCVPLRRRVPKQFLRSTSRWPPSCTAGRAGTPRCGRCRRAGSGRARRGSTGGRSASRARPTRAPRVVAGPSVPGPGCGRGAASRAPSRSSCTPLPTFSDGTGESRDEGRATAARRPYRARAGRTETRRGTGEHPRAAGCSACRG